MTPLPPVRMAMAGAGGGRRSAGATPRVTRRSSKRLVVSAPRGGPPWVPPPRSPLGSPDFDRPRRSPRLQSQKENDPAPPCAAPSPPPSPLPSPVAPRVRRSYSRLEGGGTPRGLGGAPLSPLSLNLPPAAPPEPPQIPPLDLPGIGGGPERRRKKKVAPIDLSELEAWAASMNAQFEEAERFPLVVE
ncbi:sororin [Vidua chalybeata]|uniref:sororin n=1 Tax=Vidua chalybeata TaxID=81927 RepID=UPI0023A80AEF|nr:sororin [Vidua chalybeata]